MSQPYFTFQRFRVRHDRCAMKVGTDGVLLGAWVDASQASKVLDVGTGSGLIALMLAQRFPAEITAIDVDPPSVEQANENVTESPWKEQIEVQGIALADFALQTQETFDHIVSNPPYFTRSLEAPDPRRHRARHNDTLTPQDLLAYSETLLQSQGLLSVIYPVEEADALVQLAIERGWFVARKCEVAPKPGKPVRRVLLTLSRAPTEEERSHMTLETHERHVHSPEYADLTRDFYLRYRDGHE
ncbi:MAG: methyltransferase domain-containing protein [Deltaproteobacteria bacterium]|nr:MAG: methyltransferase domain-containing protein [Deltaproteobacteria bacterium]